jgi:hypothetical protein
LRPFLTPFSYWDNHNTLICFIKVPELRVGPKGWSRIQAERKRTKLRLSEQESFHIFLCSSQYPNQRNYRRFLLLRPIKIDLPNI